MNARLPGFVMRVSLRTLIVVLFATSPAAAAEPTIEIRDVLWGFDGTVMRDRFVPVTLVVDNPTNEAYDGELRLHRTDAFGGRAGGFHVETIYLAPTTQRIVQFYPYSISNREEWIVEWQGGSMKLPSPRFAGPARVLLADDGEVFQRGGAVKRFPERYFPPLATATDCLSEVVLDHAPDWDGPRRAALLDWLKQGGRLHVLNGADGKQPTFTSELAVLNQPSDDFHVGAGLVRKHPIGRFELDSNYVRSQLDPPPRPVEDTLEEIEQRRVNQYGASYRFPLDQWELTGAAFERLRKMVKIEHEWGVIHLMSLSYVAVLFPGCFLIGREFRNVPVTFGAILGSTLLFGGAFYLVGNRGYGESTNVHAVALAEHVEGDRYDVTQWSSVFAIAGGDYRFLHDGRSRIYSDATDNEPVGGTTTSGSTGEFRVDVPPYSTRIMAHKALVRLPGATPPQSVGNQSFRLPATFPKNASAIHVLIDRKAFTAQRTGNEIRVSGTGQSLAEFLELDDRTFAGQVGMWNDPVEETLSQQLAWYVRPLILHSLRVTTDKERETFSIPPGQVRLFVYTPLSKPLETLSAEFDADGAEAPAEPLPSQSGGVLLSYTLSL